MAAVKIKDFNHNVQTWLGFIQRVKLYFVEVGMSGNENNRAKRKIVLF